MGNDLCHACYTLQDPGVLTSLGSRSSCHPDIETEAAQWPAVNSWNLAVPDWSLKPSSLQPPCIAQRTDTYHFISLKIFSRCHMPTVKGKSNIPSYSVQMEHFRTFYILLSSPDLTSPLTHHILLSSTALCGIPHADFPQPPQMDI